MQHRRVGRILKRKKGQRTALLRSLMRAVVVSRSKSIITTSAKAKEMRPRLERLITKEKSGTLAGHRAVVVELGKDAASRLKKDIVPSFSSRSSGYLRITKMGPRKSDSAKMVQISFVE